VEGEEVSREINRSGYGVFSEDFYSFFVASADL